MHSLGCTNPFTAIESYQFSDKNKETVLNRANFQKKGRIKLH